jgi:hypothetical protein
LSAGPERGHHFLVCRPPRPPVAWTPPEPTPETGYDVRYFGRALVAATRALPPTSPPLTFVLTWDLEDLPETGEHVVAIVQGDEDARIPRWADDVLVTFKCYGIVPPWMPLGRRPGMVEALEVAHFMRRAVLWAPGATRRLSRHTRPRVRTSPIHAIPLGYYNQSDLDLIEFNRRRWTVSFAGSGAAAEAVRGWRRALIPPKDRARAHMRVALDELQAALPGEPIRTLYQTGFPALLPDQDVEARALTQTYSELLADTRVCLVPRGNSPETFRFFEALRVGCIVVCEALPDHWFYRGAPVIRVRRWSELASVIRPLLEDPPTMLSLHRASLDWWATRCSEEAVGHFIAERIRASITIK